MSSGTNRPYFFDAYPRVLDGLRTGLTTRLDCRSAHLPNCPPPADNLL